MSEQQDGELKVNWQEIAKIRQNKIDSLSEKLSIAINALENIKDEAETGIIFSLANLAIKELEKK